MTTYTAVYTKPPQSVLQYEIDWSNIKPIGQTVTISSWVLSPGLIGISASTSGDITAIILAGGELGGEYTAVNTVTYANGQADQRELTIRVEKRRKNFVKRTGAALDYWIDWSDSKPTGQTIGSSIWTLDNGLNNDNDGVIVEEDQTFAILSGGVAGLVYEALNVITFSDGIQKDARIIELRII